MSTIKQKFNRTHATTVIMDMVRETPEGDLEIMDTLELDVTQVPAELVNGDGFMSLASYGLLKLVQDRNSQLSNKYLSEQGLTGEAAIRARMDAYKETYNLLVSGQFKTPATRSSGGAIDPIFAEALAEMKKVDVSTMAIKLKSLSKDERRALMELEEVKAKMQEIRERAAKAEAIDLDDLLN